MHTAVIKFNSLSDPVGSPAQNHDLLPVRYAGLIFAFIGGIIIGRGRLELRRTGIHQFINRGDVPPFADGFDMVFAGTGEMGNLDVGKPPRFGFFQKRRPVFIHCTVFRQQPFSNLLFDSRQLTQLVDKPGIDTG